MNTSTSTSTSTSLLPHHWLRVFGAAVELLPPVGGSPGSRAVRAANTTDCDMRDQTNAQSLDARSARPGAGAASSGLSDG
mgnify:CR=1 FL=1